MQNPYYQVRLYNVCPSNICRFRSRAGCPGGLRSGNRTNSNKTSQPLDRCALAVPTLAESAEKRRVNRLVLARCEQSFSAFVQAIR